jgi:hypothetical protein
MRIKHCLQATSLSFRSIFSIRLVSSNNHSSSGDRKIHSRNTAVILRKTLVFFLLNHARNPCTNSTSIHAKSISKSYWNPCEILFKYTEIHVKPFFNTLKIHVKNLLKSNKIRVKSYSNPAESMWNPIQIQRNPCEILFKSTEIHVKSYSNPPKSM